MTYECINPRCAGRQIVIDERDRTKWIHVDTGLRLCDPSNDNLQRALPKPPKERVKALPGWYRPDSFRQSGP
jgi:hypothetical protein